MVMVNLYNLFDQSRTLSKWSGCQVSVTKQQKTNEHLRLQVILNKFQEFTCNMQFESKSPQFIFVAFYAILANILVLEIPPAHSSVFAQLSLPGCVPLVPRCFGDANDDDDDTVFAQLSLPGYRGVPCAPGVLVVTLNQAAEREVQIHRSTYDAFTDGFAICRNVLL